MGSNNELNQVTQVFQVPDNIIIRALPIQKISTTPIGSPAPNFNIPAQSEPDAPLYVSDLGTGVYTNIEFLSESYQTNIAGQFRNTPRLKFDAVLLSVSQAKKIIKTEIQGRDGTIKEYIGMDDYQVQIYGVITGANGVYPWDGANQVLFLKQMLDAPVPIPVACTYLNNLGIHTLVIDSYELAQEAGGYSYQTFTMSCSSDVQQELRLTNV